MSSRKKFWKRKSEIRKDECTFVKKYFAVCALPFPKEFREGFQSCGSYTVHVKGMFHNPPERMMENLFVLNSPWNKQCYWSFGKCIWKTPFLPVMCIVAGTKLLQINGTVLPRSNRMTTWSCIDPPTGWILLTDCVSGVEDGPSHMIVTDKRGHPRQQNLWEDFGPSACVFACSLLPI